MKRTDKKFKTVAVKGGKQYVEVRERVQYLATDFDGDYSIQTEYQYFPDRKMWVVKAILTLEQGEKKCTYTGLAQEIEGGSGVNSTSALENAETSAVGRACAFAGIGVDIAICSADEVNKANNRKAEPLEKLEAEIKITPEQKAKIEYYLGHALFTPSENDPDNLKRLRSAYKDSTATKAEKAIEWLAKELDRRENYYTDSAA